MVAEKIQQRTVDQFDKLILLPENADKRLEFIAGEVVELSNNLYASKLAGLISAFINVYLIKNDVGHVVVAIISQAHSLLRIFCRALN